MADPARKTELIAELERSRSRLVANAHGLQRDLDIPSQLKRSLGRNPATWLGGTALLGLLLSRWPRRHGKAAATSRPANQAGAQKTGIVTGIALGALKLGFDAARPWLSQWLASRITSATGNRRP